MLIKNKKQNKKNGFTLIELLAIIVILAIIAVITVPIILNIIENSRRGAAKDSAYGYKDAINKWYVSKLSENPNYNIPDGQHKVGELGEQVEGKVPGNNSWYKVTKNEVTDACLQFDEYKVEIKEGKVNDPEKGQCEAQDQVVTTCGADEFMVQEYQVTDNDACLTFFNEEGIDSETATKACNGEPIDIWLGMTLSDVIKNYFIPYEYFQDFVELTDANWCRPNSEKCFSIYDNGNNTATITNYTCGKYIDLQAREYVVPEDAILDVSIPSTLTGKNGKVTVTTLGPAAFTNKGLTSVIIPNTITTIGYQAFASNDLTAVTIPNNVTIIAGGAFQNNQLTSVIIPNGVTILGSDAFRENKLTSVTIPNTVTSIESMTFSHNNLTNVTIPNSVTTIGSDAFSNNNLTNVTIPNSVTTIDDRAFFYNDLEYVVLPESVTTIGGSAFLKEQYDYYISNTELATIYNNTGKSFDWKRIVGSTTDANFETGTIINNNGDVTVTTGYPE